MPRRIRRKKGPVRAKAISYDGFNFASGLERYCYMALKKANLFDKYEGESFELQASFQLENAIYERQANGKGEFRQRSSNIRNISYTPDFTSHDYIIETKGRANEAFPLRYKMFKEWLYLNDDKRTLYKPQNQREIDIMIDVIRERRKNNRIG